jgi:hypothetical protein
MSIKLEKALQELPIILEDLHSKCDDTKYHLGLTEFENRDADAVIYDEKIYDIILCLYYNNKCISSVVGRYDPSDKSIEILSKTHEDFENRKFNLYLRTAFIYLMCFVKPTIKEVFSFSVNPISTYTMYKYYNASNEDLDEFVKDNNLTPVTFTADDAKRFHEYFKKKHTKTIESAELELEEMLEDASMEEFGWDSRKEAIEFIMNETNIEAISLALSLKKPATIKKFLLSTLSQINIKCDTKRDIKTAGKKKTKSKQEGKTKSSTRKYR